MAGGTQARTPYTPEHFDEAIDRDREPRGAYAELLPALEEHDLAEAEAEIKAHLKLHGIDFKGDTGPEEFVLDLVPRVLERSEWEELEAGLRQRARALNAFIRDAYTEQRIVREGAVPARVIETSENLEAEMVEVEVPGSHAPVIGLDGRRSRRPDGPDLRGRGERRLVRARRAVRAARHPDRRS